MNGKLRTTFTINPKTVFNVLALNSWRSLVTKSKIPNGNPINTAKKIEIDTIKTVSKNERYSNGRIVSNLSINFSPL